MKIWIIIFLTVVTASGTFADEPVKVDEFSGLDCDDYLGRMDAALWEGRKNPSAKLVFIVYEGREFGINPRTKRFEFGLPKYGLANAKFRSMNVWLKHREFPVDRASFMNGGFRDFTSVEIWLVPDGATKPVPTPTLKNLKYGKGKPNGFCTECC